MSTIKNRVEKAIKKYPFMDEVSVEEVFGILDRVRGGVDFCSASEALEDLFLDDDELKGYLRLWRETETDYQEVEDDTDKVTINEEKFSFIVVAFKNNTWGKGDSIDKAKDTLDETLGYFYDYEVDPYAIYLVNDETTINGMGSFGYPRGATPPMRIK